jgi:hypothetical protein
MPYPNERADYLRRPTLANAARHRSSRLACSRRLPLRAASGLRRFLPGLPAVQHVKPTTPPKHHVPAYQRSVPGSLLKAKESSAYPKARRRLYEANAAMFLASVEHQRNTKQTHKAQLADRFVGNNPCTAFRLCSSRPLLMAATLTPDERQVLELIAAESAYPEHLLLAHGYGVCFLADLVRSGAS